MQASRERLIIGFSVISIIFDFDGVLVESNHIRTEGFRKLLKARHFSDKQVEQLVLFHETNGGLSRYYKLKYFHEKILNKDIDEINLVNLCNEFSNIVKKDVAKACWVKGAKEFVIDNYQEYKLFVVSGSDQDELREICKIRKINKYFKEILGSPVDKRANINYLLAKYDLSPEYTLFVGDSINDFEAAQSVDVNFVARDSGNCGEWAKDLIIIKDLSQLDNCLYK